MASQWFFISVIQPGFGALRLAVVRSDEMQFRGDIYLITETRCEAVGI